MKAVELKGVSFAYTKGTRVLEGADFSASYGEVALIAGHSGEGKSTVLSIISGIIPNITEGELSGEVLIDGEDIKGRKIGYVCRKVGVVLQNADEQIINKRIEDEVAFGCENLGYPPDKIQRQIEIVCALLGLNKNAPTRTLSGGQKQRLVTASTLAMGQKIIILDEPLANLDKAGAMLLMDTLRSLAKNGYCVIVVEHRLDVVLPYVDSVWHVGGGKLSPVSDKTEYLKIRTDVIPDSSRICPESGVLLDLKDVTFGVKGRAGNILNGVTFQVHKGGRTLLLGENGCGKTTLMRIIARLSKPTGGSVTQYLDEKLKQGKKGNAKWFKKVGVVYQNPDYQLFMPTVFKEVAFGARSEEHAAEILEAFGLSALRDRHPQSLSEGQKRRLSIAAVAACEPQLLLLDEPTVGQDYEGLKELVNIVNDLHSESGNTMITVTHDVRCAEALCDEAVVIENGVVSRTGGKELVRAYFGMKGV